MPTPGKTAMVLQERASCKTTRRKRRGAVEVTAEATQVEISKWASRAPEFEPTGDHAQDAKLEIAHGKFMKLISYLQTRPAEAEAAWSMAETGAFKPLDTATLDDKWDYTVVNVQRLPKYWCAQVLAEADKSQGPIKFTKELLDAVDGKNAQNVKRIFHIVTLTAGTTRVPVKCRDNKRLCTDVFLQRIVDVGGLIIGWAAKNINPRTGFVDWAHASPYQVEWGSDDVATKITFITGDWTVFTEIVTRAFDFKDMFDIKKARAQCGLKTFYLKDFFEPGLGPHRWFHEKVDDPLDAVCEKLTTAKETLLKEAACTEMPDDRKFVGGTRAERKRKLLAESQAKAAHEREKQRLVNYRAATKEVPGSPAASSQGEDQ